MNQKNIGVTKYCDNKYWPPVKASRGLSSEIKKLMSDDKMNILDELHRISSSKNKSFEEVLMTLLSEIYSLFFHYKDSPIHAEGEIDISNVYKVKVVLEKKMKDKLFQNDNKLNNDIYESVDVCHDFLFELSNCNSGLEHSFFDYVEKEMPRDQWIEFLLMETIRNEVVDDEVAMMIPGLQHAVYLPIN